MQVRVTKQDLYSITSRMQVSFGDKDHANVAINADSRGLRVQAEDWLLTTCSSIDCEVIEQGRCCVPAALFANVVRELPEGDVGFACDDGRTLVLTSMQSQHFYFKLPCIEQTWVEPAPLHDGDCLSFSVVEFDYMLSQVVATVQQESTRPYATTGCFHKLDEKTLRLVASDGYTLSYCDLQGSAAIAAFPQQICVGRRALLELQRACRECAEENISLYVLQQGRVLAVASEGRRVYIRVSAIDFPSYDSALHDIGDMQSCIVVRSDFQMALKRVLLATNRKMRGVRLEFSAGKLTLQAGKSSSSECRESFAVAKHTTAATAAIDVNGRFINSILATIAYDNILIYFVNDEYPLVIMPETELPSCRSRHVVQPIRERT
ncbi:MAG: hypothetical protein OYH77_07625 [Pseudomonadota bacterium]|nr:hypothetical protein [Pseudomonadota bacterium]